MKLSVSSGNGVVVPLIITLVSLVAPGSNASMVGNLLNKAYDLLGYETCGPSSVFDDGVERLRKALRKELFGQHLAVNITLTAIKAHLDDPDPSKALVLSMHGWAGAGKTFTSQHLMKAIYKSGVNSSFVRFFMSSYHFPDPNKVKDYKKLIKENIEKTIKGCPRSLFIFDEVDKTPVGVLDALVPFVHHPGNMLDGYDYKKSIYVFLSNTGANEITHITKRAWQEGTRREELTFTDFAETLSNEAFNSRSTGLYRSRMIDKVLVDYFVPFLPLERRHVISCIKVEARRHGMNQSIINEEAEKIADLLTYWPADLKLYSTSGCKKVDTFVKYRIAELELANMRDDETDEEDTELENEDKKRKEDLKTEL